MFLMYKLDSCQPPPLTQCIVKVLFGGKTAAVLSVIFLLFVYRCACRSKHHAELVAIRACYLLAALA